VDWRLKRLKAGKKKFRGFAEGDLEGGEKDWKKG